MLGAVWASLVSYIGITVLVSAYHAWWCDKKPQSIEEKFHKLTVGTFGVE
jgi:hypothetical protein